jgi:hypothetical protein
MEDDEEIDYEVATDEESLKIRRLEHDLSSVSVSEDRRLFICIGVGLVPILFYVLSPGYMTQWLVLTVTPVSILGGLGFVIFKNFRRKRRILIKHGLQCTRCGFIPSPLNASGVLGIKKCPKCDSRLDV